MPGGVGGVQVIGPYPDQTPLDPSDAIVLFADLQAGIIERAATNDLASLRRTVAALAKLAQLFEIPAIVTTAPGVARVMPEIAAALGELPSTHARPPTPSPTLRRARPLVARGARRCSSRLKRPTVAGNSIRRRRPAENVLDWLT